MLDDTFIESNNSGGYLCKLDSRQFAWLRKDIQAIDKKTIKGVVIVQHIPMFNAKGKVAMENGDRVMDIFRDYPLNVGGKTGTAQVGENKSANAVFCAFAPWEDPEIAVSCIIEQGGNGTDAGVAVREIFDLYFGLGDYAPAP